MATTDIRLERIKEEYAGVRDAQDALMDRIDTYEAALLGLNEAVAANYELIMANQQQIAETRQDISELHCKLDAIMKHQDVPYKPQAGFVKE